ncbi:MAG: hypothetical protein ABL882_05035 [Sphingopyxis sp.]
MTTLRKSRPVLALIATISLAGCDWMGGGSSADTDMRNVEILPGTTSDEMITLDQASGDGTAIDTSVAIAPAAPSAASDADDDAPVADASDAAEEPKGDTSNNGDVTIRPPSGGAEPSGPENKK